MTHISIFNHWLTTRASGGPGTSCTKDCAVSILKDDVRPEIFRRTNPCVHVFPRTFPWYIPLDLELSAAALTLGPPCLLPLIMMQMSINTWHVFTFCPNNNGKRPWNFEKEEEFQRKWNWCTWIGGGGKTKYCIWWSFLTAWFYSLCITSKWRCIAAALCSITGATV